ncbi:MAG: Wzz/FepE/Etk N-terminal domain-containing protein [Anaerolineales bacterium]
MNQSPHPSINYLPDDEIDLRKWLLILWQARYWIVGIPLVLGILVFIGASFLPKMYKATALVAVTQSRYNLNFDPRIQTINDPNRNYQSFVRLATSGDVVQQLYASLTRYPIGVKTPFDLASRLDAELENDLILLSVSTRDPQFSAQIADQWAEIYVVQANQVYGTQDETQPNFFNTQLFTATNELAAAEDALIAFQARNRLSMLYAQRDALQASLVNLTAQIQRSQNLLADAQALRSQFQQVPSNTLVAPGEQLAALVLQTQAVYNAKWQDDDSPLILQLGDPKGDLTVGEQVAALGRLMLGLQSRLKDLNAQIAAIEPQLLALQEEIKRLETEQDTLTRNRDLLKETYITLVRKAEESRIANQNTSGQVRLASRAIIPEKSTGPGRLIFTLLTIVLSGIAVVVSVLARAWWNEPTLKPHASTPQQP